MTFQSPVDNDAQKLNISCDMTEIFCQTLSVSKHMFHLIFEQIQIRYQYFHLNPTICLFQLSSLLWIPRVDKWEPKIKKKKKFMHLLSFLEQMRRNEAGRKIIIFELIILLKQQNVILIDCVVKSCRYQRHKIIWIE